MSLPSRQWLMLLVPVFCIALWMLMRSILGLLQTTRGSIVAALPSVKEQKFTLPAAGTYNIMVEGRLFTSDFAHADFAVNDSTGAAVPIRTVFVRTAVKSMGRVRLALREFDVPSAGSYTLVASGISREQDADNRLIVSRPIGGAIVLRVLGIVVSGIFVIASLVGSIILLVGRRGTTP